MRIRTKIVLIFLPLIITPLVLTTAAASLAARNGITGVATGLLRFKAEQLESYARGQWSLLTANNLQGNPRFVDAVREGIGAFAAGLVRSPSEMILAVDDAGRVAMASARVELSASETQELAILAQTQSRGWRAARLAGTARVIQTFYFEPLQWLVVVSEESGTFYSAVMRIYSQSGLIAAASLAATLALILLFSHYLTRPLREVVAAMRDIITSSDLSRRVTISYQDETGELAHTFNLMTGELEKAYSQIKSFALRASVAERRERKLRNVFQLYVPRDVIDQHVGNPEALLKGDNPVVAILISDVRSFTTISEKLPPDDLVEMLNRYFTAWVDAVMAHGGIVDKYMGDAILAFYGAPAKHSDDPARALRSAFDMLRALVGFNAWQRQRERPEFHVGIGINYGVTTVGNIGHAEKKLNYTIIGDQVNLASRLEGLTKQYGEPVIISESMYRYVGREFPCRIVDRVAVKGRSMGVTIYTPRESLTTDEERGWELHHSALQCYYNREFAEAVRRFEEVGRILPGDRVSRIFVERAREFAVSPPSDHWNGVEEKAEK